jgi:hypothetical protein
MFCLRHKSLSSAAFENGLWTAASHSEAMGKRRVLSKQIGVSSRLAQVSEAPLADLLI